MTGTILRILGVLVLVAFPLGAGMADTGFTNVKGGSISDQAPVTNRDPGEVVVFVDFLETTVTADLVLAPDGSNDVFEVSVDLGGWLCFREKITLDLLSRIVNATRDIVVNEFISRLGAGEAAVLQAARRAAPDALVEAIDAQRIATSQHNNLEWPAGQDFRASFANCYTAFEIRKLQTAMLPAIQGRIERGLSPGKNLEPFSDPFNSEPTNNDDDDPIELGDRELIQ